MAEFTAIERVIVDFYEANEVPVHETGGEWFVVGEIGDDALSLTALAIAVMLDRIRRET